MTTALTPTAHRGRGQPSKFTPDTCERILANLRAGHHYETACKLAGVSYETFRSWIRAANDGDPVYLDFSEQVKLAEAEAEARHLENIDKESVRDWHASGWILTRRFPERWADQSRRTVTHEGTVTHAHVHTLAMPDPEQLAQLVGLLGAPALPAPLDGQAATIEDAE